MLSYADVPLVIPTKEMVEWIEKNISVQDVYEWVRMYWPGPRLTHHAFNGMPDRHRGVKVGCLHWPWGASRWAVGHFLASSQQLEAIRPSVYGGALSEATLAMVGNNHDGSERDRIETKLFMLPPRPLAQLASIPESLSQLYLLTLVDKRFFWWQKHTDDLVVDEGTTTWDDLLDKLGETLGTVVNRGVIPAAYLKPGKSMTALSESLPIVLDSVAYNVGRRIVRQLDGTVTAMDGETARNQDDLNRMAAEMTIGKQAGGYFKIGWDGDHVRPLIPGTVRVVYRSTRNRYGIARDKTRPIDEVWTADVDFNDVSATIAIPFLVSNQFTKTFHDGAEAVFTIDPETPSNAQELEDLAKQIAVDWYKHQLGTLDVKLPGIVNVALNSNSDVEWTYRVDEVSTRIQRGPWMDLTSELGHFSKTLPRGLTVQDDQWSTHLLSDLNTDDDKLYVDSSALFPNEPGFHIRIRAEVMKVTEIDKEKGEWKVLRAQFGTFRARHDAFERVWFLQHPITAKLAAAINEETTTISLDRVGHFPTLGKFYFTIGQEAMLALEGGGTTTWKVKRGVLGTKATSHAGGATIVEAMPNSVFDVKRIHFEDFTFVNPGNDDGEDIANYREPMQIIEIVSAAPNEKGYYEGYRLKWDPVSRKTDRDVKIWFIDLNHTN